MIYDIQVREGESRPVLSVRVVTRRETISETIAEILRETYAYVAELGIEPSGRPFTRYHMIAPAEFDLEAGVPIAEPIPGRGRIISNELPGGLLACTWHTGFYDSLFKAYEALEEWIRDHRYEPASAPWEVYWTDPAEVPDPTRWRTEVIWPIREG
ncbi:MAG TPA: AraC family transcriptional regulator [Chloroflexi bacterium]|jgi:effector-binding domain-containing protein|nr:AraC family transcriptional regulator [Chloroflexota bacterium]